MVDKQIIALADQLDFRLHDKLQTSMRSIAEDWLSNQEFGLSLEMLVDFLIEEDIPITYDELARIKSIADHLGISDRIMSDYLFGLSRRS